MFEKAEIEINNIDFVDIIITSDIPIIGPPDWEEWEE